MAVSQASVVQALLSLQTTAMPGAQKPLALHRSGAVQALPSVQGSAVSAVFLQPLLLLHESTVHTLPSSQLMVVPWQLPALQASPEVQALLSLQTVAVCAVFLQPVATSQVSSVQGLASSQLGAAPGWQVPLAVHRSPTVQALPSVQLLPVAGVFRQPPAVVQVSVVHGLLSSQLSVAPVQLPALHLSPVVQASPSVQAVPVSAVFLQPADRSHTSCVHALLSSQFTALPGWQAPCAVHLSPLVQALPSVQACPVSAVFLQPSALSQLSWVQALPSSQLMVVP